MEFHQEEHYYSRKIVIKGKRTKRPRPPSPLALTMASTSITTTTTTTTTTTASDDVGDNSFHTPTIEFSKLVQENNEEEDMMAKCLILLASSSPPQPSGLLHKATVAVEAERTSGLCVYECKTCNRGFSSFQALGGHRASHKKPSKTNMMKVVQDMDYNIHCSSTTLSLQIGSNPTRTTKCNPASSGSIKVAKIHDCSICGAEFGSGQALGGHMRRHRSMPSMPTSTTNCGDSGRYRDQCKKPKTLLSLDLNLPAPIEDDHREIKFPFRTKDQMIVFSNSSLVHCHI